MACTTCKLVMMSASQKPQLLRLLTDSNIKFRPEDVDLTIQRIGMIILEARRLRLRDHIAVAMAQFWWSGIVVSTLALINEVNQRRSRLVQY